MKSVTTWILITYLNGCFLLFCLSVATNLPALFHIITLLVSTGPLPLRASIHGLVINILHSLCTCSQLKFSGKFGQVMTTPLYAGFEGRQIRFFKFCKHFKDFYSTAILEFRVENALKCIQKISKKSSLSTVPRKSWQTNIEL